MAVRPRNLQSIAAEALAIFPAVMLLGARQVGKSTLARLLTAQGAHYTTLDDASTLSLAEHDPVGYLTMAGTGTLVIDELQRRPELMLDIKATIDRDRRPGRFILTGSADLLRLQRTPDSLAGRAALLQVEGFSQGELHDHVEDFVALLESNPGDAASSPLGLTDYSHRMIRGGFPEVQQLPPRTRRLWFDSYLTQSVQRDAGDLGVPYQPGRLYQLLRVLAANQSGELVKAHAASRADLPATSITPYLDLLSRLFLTYTLPPWTNNPLQRVTGKPKSGIRDVGLAAHLVGASQEQLATPGSPQLGGLLESFVATELLKQRTWSEQQYDLHHFRDSRGNEVDIIIELADGRVWGVEVKASQTVRFDHFATLAKLRDRLGPRFRGGVVLSLHPDPLPMGPSLWALPVSALWS